MKQFEYKVISRLIGVEKRLNELGYEGWELVAVECGTFYSSVSSKNNYGKI